MPPNTNATAGNGGGSQNGKTTTLSVNPGTESSPVTPGPGSDRILNIAIPKTPGSRHLWVNGETTWDEICAWVKSPRTGQKDGPGYVLGLLQETTGCSVSPNCRGVHRNKEAVVSRSVITLDADNLIPATRDSLLATLRGLGWAVVVYSTASSTPVAPRLRILLLPDRDLLPDEYRRAVRYLMGLLGRDAFDKGSVEPERFMYMPTTPAEGDFYSEVK